MKRWIVIGILAIVCSSAIAGYFIRTEDIQELNMTISEQAEYIGYQKARIDELLVDLGGIGYGEKGVDGLEESITLLEESIRDEMAVRDRLIEWNDYLAESIDKLEKKLDQLGVKYEPVTPWPGIK